MIPLVVGYKGEIGSFILQGLLKTIPKALDIWCFDINETEKEKIDRIKKSDTIFLCIPIQDTVEWLFKYQKYLKGKKIIEQCSIKGIIFGNKKLLCKINHYSLFSMHILFRPSITPNKEDRKVMLIEHYPVGWGGLEKTIEKITDSKIVWIRDYKTHDIVMARQQALIHRVLLCLDNLIENSCGQTYIGKKLMELTNRIKSGDKILYSSIQKNKYLPEVLKEFNKNLRDFDITKEIKLE